MRPIENYDRPSRGKFDNYSVADIVVELLKDYGEAISDIERLQAELEEKQKRIEELEDEVL